MHDYVRNVFTIEKGGRKFSLIPLQNEELGRRNLSIGNQVELENLWNICGGCEEEEEKQRKECAS